MTELFKAVIAIHQGFTMTGYEWEPQWTSDCSKPNHNQANWARES